MACGIWIALLYSVVLGPGRRVEMAPLRAMAEGLGIADVRTLKATGNLVFAGDGPADLLEARLEAAFATHFGRAVTIIVRSAAGWRGLAAANPFPAAAQASPKTVHVRVMRAPLATKHIARLEAARTGDERFAVVHGDPWLHMPQGAAASRLAAAAGSAGVGKGTFRN